MKTLKAGKIVKWNNRQYEIKEYMSHGIYQAHDIKTYALVYIPKEEIKEKKKEYESPTWPSTKDWDMKDYEVFEVEI